MLRPYKRISEQAGQEQAGRTAASVGFVEGHFSSRGGSSAFAPEEIGGEAKSEERDGDGQVNELFRVEKGDNDGVADYGCCCKNKQQRSPRIAGDAIGNGQAFAGAA